MRSTVEKLALTISEAVALGGPCRSALYQDIKKGRLRAIKRGKSTRILLADFKNYLGSFPSLHSKRTETSEGQTTVDSDSELKRQRPPAGPAREQNNG
jgi:hypothetical protein